jgi:hypothetical protein
MWAHVLPCFWGLNGFLVDGWYAVCACHYFELEFTRLLSERRFEVERREHKCLRGIDCGS